MRICPSAQQILMKSTTDKRNKYREFLSDVEMLSQVEYGQVQTLGSGWDRGQGQR